MKNLFWMAIVAITFASCQPTSYTIKGTIKGNASGNVVLNELANGKPTPLDTAEIVEGKFTFKGAFDEPQLYFIYIDGHQNPIVFFGENAKINIEVNVDKIQDAVVTGSSVNDIYSSFVKGVPGSARLEQMNVEYQDAVNKGNHAKMESLREEVSQVMEEQKAYFLDFVRNNTNNIVGAHMALQALPEFEMDEFKELVAKFEANLGTSRYVTDLKRVMEPMQQAADAEKITKIGAVAPDFTLGSIDGKSVTLSSFKGKYLLVDFWASWCGPCREENPNVVKAYNKYASKGFDILGVSLDRDAKAWEKAIKDDGLTWTQVIDGEQAVANIYGVTGIPFTLLLDKEGNIIAKNLRGTQLEERLAELLN